MWDGYRIHLCWFDVRGAPSERVCDDATSPSVMANRKKRGQGDD